jgi:hypothetical protein
MNMKTKFNKYALAVVPMILTLILVNFSSCEDEPTAQEKTTDLLTTSTWKMQSVTVDGTDQTNVYKGLGLTFTPTSFTSTNGGVVWPASSGWTFTDGGATAIKRDDGLEITLQEITESSLKMALIWSKTTVGPGRINSVSGQHIFSFGK